MWMWRGLAAVRRSLPAIHQLTVLAIFGDTTAHALQSDSVETRVNVE